MRRFFASLAAVLLFGCAPAASQGVPENVITVAVYSDGRVAIDGEMTSLDELQPLFRAAAQDQKSVWYYRENYQQEPTGPSAAAVEEVVRSIAENRLPISLSTRPDFSDYVDAEGVAHPRRFGAKQ